MNVGELLDAAKRKQGSLGAVAQRMGIEQSRLSKWRSGDRKPDAADIMLLAEIAGLPPFETLARIEQEIDEKNASVWARALGNLRAAGVAATVILGLVIYSMTPKTASAAVTNFVTPSPASAAPHQESRAGSVEIMSNCIGVPESAEGSPNSPSSSIPSTDNKLRSPAFHASRRLPRAGVFWWQQFYGRPAADDHHECHAAYCEYTNTGCAPPRPRSPARPPTNPAVRITPTGPPCKPPEHHHC